jgi:hypothetical protein
MLINDRFRKLLNGRASRSPAIEPNLTALNSEFHFHADDMLETYVLIRFAVRICFIVSVPLLLQRKNLSNSFHSHSSKNFICVRNSLDISESVA